MRPTKTIVVEYEQTLTDIALQEYGAVEAVRYLLADNPALSYRLPYVSAGTQLVVRTNLNALPLARPLQVQRYRSLRHKPATGRIRPCGWGAFNWGEANWGQFPAACVDGNAPTLACQPLTTALQFDGANDYVLGAVYPELEVAAGADFAISAWVYLDIYRPENTIFSAQNRATSGLGGHNWYCDNGDVKYRNYDTNNVVAIDFTNVNLEAKKWHHLVLLRRSNVWSLYWNGTEYSPTSTAYPGQLLVAPDEWQLGRRYYAGLTRYYAGRIADFRMEKYPPSPQNISRRYNAGASCLSLGVAALSLPLQHTSGSVAEDNSGNNQDGTLTNFTGPASTIWVDGPAATP